MKMMMKKSVLTSLVLGLSVLATPMFAQANLPTVVE